MILVGGLVALAQAFSSLPATTKLLIAVPISAALVFLYFYAAATNATDIEDDTPVSLRGPHVFKILPFFNSRFDFLNSTFALSGRAIFKFKLLQVRHSTLSTSLPFLGSSSLL